MLSANTILLLPYQVWKPFIYCLVIYRIYKIFSKIMFIFIKIFNWFLGAPVLENLCLIQPVILNCCCVLQSSGGFKNILVPRHSLFILFLEFSYFHIVWFHTVHGERLKAGGEGDDRGWDGWMASPTRWRSKLQELVMDREACHTAVLGVAEGWTRLSDWTELLSLS